MNRGLFLDLDGTLANSIPLLRETYRRFLAEQGQTDTDEEFTMLNGPPLDKVVSILKAKYQLAASEPELLIRYMNLIRKGYLETEPNPGARDILAHAVSLGWRCAVVTSNSEDLTRAWLSKNQLLETISDVIGKESVRFGKPDPEPYLLALQRLNCDAETSIAIEDSAAGIISASRAKLQTYAYTSSTTELEGLPIRYLHSFFDLKPWLIHD